MEFFGKNYLFEKSYFGNKDNDPQWCHWWVLIQTRMN